MGPNNTPEQPPKKSMQEQARETAEQIIAEVRASYRSEVVKINQIQDDTERIRARAQLEQRSAEEFRLKLNEQIRDAADTGKVDLSESKQEKATKAKHIFLEAKALGDEGVKVGDAKSQQVVNKIVEYIKNGQISDEGALVLERNIGKDLIDGIVFSKSGDPPSNFEKHLKISYEVNSVATTPLLRDLKENQDVFGYEGTPQDLLQKIGMSTSENDQQEDLTPKQQQMIYEDGGYIRDSTSYGYQSRFTEEQLELISTFYSPEKFVNYLESMNEGTFLKGGKEEAVRIKQKIAEDIKEYYKKNNKDFKIGDSLEKQVEKLWGEKVSEAFDWKVSDVVNQLFLELQQKSPNKFYEQIMQEDMFYGPAAIQKRIQAAINSLMTKIEQIEGGGDDLAKRIDKLHLYEQDVFDPYIEERGKQGEDKKIYPRLHPLTHGKEVGLTDFIRHVYVTIDHTIEKAEYFHNSRAIYGHPPGEKGFYQQLGDFAEHIKGVGIDEILLLPDGQYVMQAYQLYEKMLQEDFAQMDHRHRPDQLSNELEKVNSNIEKQVFDQLKEYYPELSTERLHNIVNSGVGISRGITLTESEISAYADPIDSEGKGMVASYSTNDAGSLNVFNPMHTILRWQGEHNINLMYFMPVDGEPGPWDHNKAMKNAAKYHDSLLVGKGRGTGKDALPKETFADAMMNIGKVGGPGERKGWRMKHPLEGHFKYNSDGTIDIQKTFRAMEAIGYEAIFDFIEVQLPGREEGVLKTTKGPLVDRRNELFRYMYERYFDQGKSFNEYLNELKIRGEDKASEQLIKGSNNSWDEQVQLETSKLFMNNFIAHYVAERFPTKFMRIDRNRFNDDGISRWEKIWREFKDNRNWKREDFDKTIKDIEMAEMLLRRKISEKIRNNMKFDENWTLDMINEIDNLPYRLDEGKIKELLEKKYESNDEFKSPKEIKDAIELWRYIKKDLDNKNFLDGEAYKKIKEFPFTFGLEDTDMSLMAFRATGPRMVARAIKDVASVEENITKWILNMPMILNEIAINGKNDISPIIEYMRKAQKAITDINGVPDTYEHMYKMAGTIINYFKKDAITKPLFGLFGLGRKNSIAAEYAGKSSAVWEWDSRDIDRFCISLESYGLLKNSPYDLQKFKNGKFVGGELEDRWIKIPGIKKPIKFGKKRHVDYKYNSLKLRKDHGADLKAITWDYINQFLPFAIAFLLWKYIKDALDEASGKKK